MIHAGFRKAVVIFVAVLSRAARNAIGTAAVRVEFVAIVFVVVTRLTFARNLVAETFATSQFAAGFRGFGALEFLA